MKKLTKILVFAIVLISIGIAGCEKQIGTEQHKTLSNNKIIFKTEKGLPVFSNEKNFVAAYNELSKELNSNEETDSSLSVLLERNNQYQTLMDKYLKEEKEWLDHEKLDLGNDPDDKYVDDDALRLLLNSQNEIIIGTSIYKFAKENVIYKIKNKNWAVLDKIRKNSDNFSKFSANKDVVLLNYDPDKSSCRSNFTYHGFKNYKTNRLVKWKASIINTSQYGIPITSVKAKTISYKLRNRRWIKYRTKIVAQIYGFYIQEMRLGPCDDNVVGDYRSGQISSSNSSSSVKCRIGNGAYPFYVKNRGITMHYVCDTWSKTYTLEW